MKREHSKAKPRGSAVVEFAVLVPVLIAILCGTIDWGYYFFTREIVVHASREGARVGTLQFAGGLTEARTQAETAARRYLLDSALEHAAAARIRTNFGADGAAACPSDASCLRIEYDLGGSVTGFTGSFVPSSIIAYAQMRR